MTSLLRKTFPVSSLVKGFVLLNLVLSPLTLMTTLFIGIMGGGSPNSPGALVSFAIAAAFIYLVPCGFLVAHIVLGKIFDTIFLVVPPLKMEISWFGLALAGVILVILGNVFVDDLYQVRRGDFTMSFFALGADLAGIFFIIACSSIPIPFLKRRASPAT